MKKKLQNHPDTTKNTKKKRPRKVGLEPTFLGRFRVIGTIIIFEKKNTKNVFFFQNFNFFLRQGGIGESGLEVDFYLLDNRNRTQKWDE